MTPWRTFLYAWTLDRAADMLWTTVLAWLATTAPNPAVQGLILSAAVLPNLFMLLVGGALADKYGSAQVAKFTTVAKIALLGALMVSGTGGGALIALALVAAGLGAVDGFHDPALESWGTRLRRPDEQTEAAATEATLWRIAQTAGATLGGLLLGVSATLALSIGIGLYLIQRVLLEHLGRSPAGHWAGKTAPEFQGSAREQIGRGLAFLKNRPVLWATTSMQTLCTLTVGAVLMLLTASLVRDQGWPPVTYGIAAAGFGLGMATGAGTVMKRQQSGKSRRRPADVPYVAFVVGATGHLPLIALILAPETIGPVGLTVVLALFGLLVGPVSPIMHGFRRGQTPEHLFGVVAGTARLVVYGPEPLGPLAAGALVAVGGTKLAFGVIVIAAVSIAGIGAAGARLGEHAAVT